jgi:hypothetical protein
MGWCFDVLGGYEASLWLFLAILCLLVPAAALATPPPGGDKGQKNHVA